MLFLLGLKKIMVCERIAKRLYLIDHFDFHLYYSCVLNHIVYTFWIACRSTFLMKIYYFKIFYFFNLKVTYFKCNVDKSLRRSSSLMFPVPRLVRKKLDLVSRGKLEISVEPYNDRSHFVIISAFNAKRSFLLFAYLRSLYEYN